MNSLRNLSNQSRTVFVVVALLLIAIALYAFFTSELGRALTLICCGGVILVVILGIMSERGMRPPR